MSSKHDILTTVITLALLILFGALEFTHNLTNGAETTLTAALSGVVSYWFVRGGSAIANSAPNTTTQPQQDTSQLVADGVQLALDKLGQTPATTGGASVETNTKSNVQS